MRAVAATTSGRPPAPAPRARVGSGCRAPSGRSPPGGARGALTGRSRRADRPSRSATISSCERSSDAGGARSRSRSGTVARALSTETNSSPSGSLANARDPAFAPLRYEIVQGALVRWSAEQPEGPHPPTAVLIHGILGSRRNLLSFAKRLAQAFPSWQFVLVDLRCHGQTASMPSPPGGEHSVTSAARDVLGTLNALKIYPHSLIGHSFGGKVAMSMVHQFGKRLPRPVQVWVLDTVPGDVWCEAGDHPRDTIEHCRTIAMPVPTRKFLVDSLVGAGFTLEGAQWMTTNLTPCSPEAFPDAPDGALTWTFDLPGIVEMYKSYEETDLWPMLETPPDGLEVDFVRAERSAFVWADADVARMTDTGARVHFLRDASHWVHIDNPDGLLEILAPSFGAMDRTQQPARKFA